MNQDFEHQGKTIQHKMLNQLSRTWSPMFWNPTNPTNQASPKNFSVLSKPQICLKARLRGGLLPVRWWETKSWILSGGPTLNVKTMQRNIVQLQNWMYPPMLLWRCSFVINRFRPPANSGLYQTNRSETNVRSHLVSLVETWDARPTPPDGNF